MQDASIKNGLRIRGLQVQVLSDAPFKIKDLRSTKAPETHFAPDKSLSNGGETASPDRSQNVMTSTGAESEAVTSAVTWCPAAAMYPSLGLARHFRGIAV